MPNLSKQPLTWYEENAQEINHNPDGSVTYVFDESFAPPSQTTISKEEYQKARKDPTYLV